jgi:hypothetical protein
MRLYAQRLPEWLVSRPDLTGHMHQDALSDARAAPLSAHGFAGPIGLSLIGELFRFVEQR